MCVALTLTLIFLSKSERLWNTSLAVPFNSGHTNFISSACMTTLSLLFPFVLPVPPEYKDCFRYDSRVSFKGQLWYPQGVSLILPRILLGFGSCLFRFCLSGVVFVGAVRGRRGVPYIYE